MTNDRPSITDLCPAEKKDPAPVSPLPEWCNDDWSFLPDLSKHLDHPWSPRLDATFPQPDKNGKVETDKVHLYLDRVFPTLKAHGCFPESVRHKTDIFHVKYLLNGHKKSCMHCRIRAHPGTGKASLLVLTLSLAYMHKKTYARAEEIIRILEDMYEIWKATTYERKESQLKHTLQIKVARFDAVLYQNRQIPDSKRPAKHTTHCLPCPKKVDANTYM